MTFLFGDTTSTSSLYNDYEIPLHVHFHLLTDPYFANNSNMDKSLVKWKQNNIKKSNLI